MKPRVLLDVDDVIADFTGFYLDRVQEVTGLIYCHEEVTEWSISRSLKLTLAEKQRVEFEIERPGAALRIQELPGAVEAVKQLAELAEVFFVTSPWDSNRTWSHDRRQWLVDRFGELGKNVAHTNCKQICAGDVLVDDKPENLIGWTCDPRNQDGIPVLWDHPANRSFDVAGTSLLRRSSWTDVLDLVQSL